MLTIWKEWCCYCCMCLSDNILEATACKWRRLCWGSLMLEKAEATSSHCFLDIEELNSWDWFSKLILFPPGVAEHDSLFSRIFELSHGDEALTARGTRTLFLQQKFDVTVLFSVNMSATTAAAQGTQEPSTMLPHCGLTSHRKAETDLLVSTAGITLSPTEATWRSRRQQGGC